MQPLQYVKMSCKKIFQRRLPTHETSKINPEALKRKEVSLNLPCDQHTLRASLLASNQ